MDDKESIKRACDNIIAAKNFVSRKRETRGIIEITEAHYQWLCENNNNGAKNGNVYDGNNNLIAWKHGGKYWGMK